MSANPEAFNYVREAAYQFVNEHGKDAQKLHAHCTSIMNNWIAGEGYGSGLSDNEAKRIVDDITRWVVNRYNPPKPTPDRHREERAATVMLAPLLLEYAAETHGKATIRNAARFSDQAKTTVARHLRQQGIAPKRQKKIETLPAKVRWLVSILDVTFPNDGAAVIMVDDLVAAIWDKISQSKPGIARSTLITRREKLQKYLSAVTDANIGYHFQTRDDVIAVRRGRRFKSLKDTTIWIEDERSSGNIRAIIVPADKPKKAPFWGDPWLQDVLHVLEIGLWRGFTDASQLEPLVRLMRPLLDPAPLYYLSNLAIHKGYQDHFPTDLLRLSDRVKDPIIRNATRVVAHSIANVWDEAEWQPHPVDYFRFIDRHLNFMQLVSDVSPESFARLCHLRDVVFEKLAEETKDEAYPLHAVLERCKQLAELERQGK